MKKISLGHIWGGGKIFPQHKFLKFLFRAKGECNWCDLPSVLHVSCTSHLPRSPLCLCPRLRQQRVSTVPITTVTTTTTSSLSPLWRKEALQCRIFRKEGRKENHALEQSKKSNPHLLRDLRIKNSKTLLVLSCCAKLLFYYALLVKLPNGEEKRF